MEIIEKKTETQERISLQLEKKIKELEKLGDDTSALWKQLSELQEYINISKEDLQSIRMYFSNFSAPFKIISFEALRFTNLETLMYGFALAIFQKIIITILLTLLVLGCILLNHTRGLKKFHHRLDAVLLHLKMTG